MAIQLSAPILQYQKTLLQTLTPASVTSISTSTLVAYNSYVVEFDRISSDSAAGEFQIQFNSDAGANYSYIRYTTAGIANSTAQTSARIGGSGQPNTDGISAMIWVCGKSPAVASGVINGSVLFGSSVGGGLRIGWTAGNAVQVSTMTFLNNGVAFTGTIRVYGVNNI